MESWEAYISRSCETIVSLLPRFTCVYALGCFAPRALESSELTQFLQTPSYTENSVEDTLAPENHEPTLTNVCSTVVSGAIGQDPLGITSKLQLRYETFT